MAVLGALFDLSAGATFEDRTLIIMEKITLIIESAKENELWGRVLYDDNLIAEEASAIPELEEKMRLLLQEFHWLNPKEITFDLHYDMAGPV